MSVNVKIFDNKYIPGIGRGPITNTITISDELFRTLKMLDYNIVKIKANPYKKEFKEVVTKVIKEVENDKKEKSLLPEINEEIETEIKEFIPSVEEPEKEEVEVIIEENQDETTEKVEDLENEYTPNFEKMSNSDLRSFLKDHSVKYSNAMSRDKLIELAKSV